MKSQQSETLPHGANILVQDSVVTYVERELQDMESIAKPNLKSSLKYSEELLRFIETELENLDSRVVYKRDDLENKSDLCCEIPKTKNSKIPLTARNIEFLKSPNLRISHAVDTNIELLKSKKSKIPVTERNIEPVTKRKNSHSYNKFSDGQSRYKFSTLLGAPVDAKRDTAGKRYSGSGSVLCLKDLDNPPKKFVPVSNTLAKSGVPSAKLQYSAIQQVPSSSYGTSTLLRTSSGVTTTAKITSQQGCLSPDTVTATSETPWWSEGPVNSTNDAHKEDPCNLYPPFTVCNFTNQQSSSVTTGVGVNIHSQTYFWTLEQVSISAPTNQEKHKNLNLSRPLKKRRIVACDSENSTLTIKDNNEFTLNSNSALLNKDTNSSAINSEIVPGSFCPKMMSSPCFTNSEEEVTYYKTSGVPSQNEEISPKRKENSNLFSYPGGDEGAFGGICKRFSGTSLTSVNNWQSLCSTYLPLAMIPDSDNECLPTINIKNNLDNSDQFIYRKPMESIDKYKKQDSIDIRMRDVRENNEKNPSHPQYIDVGCMTEKSSFSSGLKQENTEVDNIDDGKAVRGNSGNTKTTVHTQDILHIAIKRDLFDITDENAMYSWPEVEDMPPISSATLNAVPNHQIIPEFVPISVFPEEGTDSSSIQKTNIESHGEDCVMIEEEEIKSETKVDEIKVNAIQAYVESLITLSNSDDCDETDEDDPGVHVDSEFDMLTHADQLPFRCEFCGRLFKHKRSRDRHVKLHTGDKKYKCCHCEAAFSRSDHLKIHKKTHDTQKPYQCNVCNRGYNTAAALTAHMQNHKAKLTAQTLNQLLKDVHAPGESHTLTNLLRDPASDPHSQSVNNFLKDNQKEQQLLSPRGVDIGSRSSPGELTTSPVGEPSPSLSPAASLRCPVCQAPCRNHAHLQRHVARHHGEDMHDRPASRSGGSASSSVGGASSAASTPSPRPPSSLPSPRPLPNPLLSLVGGKLACLYCSRDGFPSLEALQLHLQSSHGSVLNGEVRDMASMLGLPASLGATLGTSSLPTSLTSPLGPGSSRGVSCELCGARVTSVTALQRHVVTCHTFTDLLARAAEGVFCAQCLLPFSNPGALAEHIKLVHAGPVLSAVLNKRPPSPPNDTPTDLSKKSRHDNLTSDLPANTLLCSQCNAPFTNFEAFRRHLKSHLDGTELASSGTPSQLACPECRLPLTSETSLETHLASHLGVTSTEYGCQACMKLFPKPDELQKHLMDIHAHHLYRCALCKEMFDSKVSIQVHFAVKHSNECIVHKCTRCSLIFRSQTEFEGHIRGSHMRRGQGNESGCGGGIGGSGGSYRCLLCTLSLSSEAELAAHVSTHQRQFQCSLCDDAFHVEFLLDKHMQTQHNSELNGNIPQPENLVKPRRSPLKKDLRCDICDAEFSSDSTLVNHRKQAHNIKSGSIGITAKVAAASLSLFCAYCSEVCKSRSDLEAHMKSHQGNGGRHKCNICDELCPSAALLAQHKLTHVKVVSGSACAVCREPLTSEQQFTSHQNDHHPAPLPQPCVVCRQTLVTDMEVSVHARFHAAQAAQAAAAASIASSAYSSCDLLPHSTSVITTAATASTITTNSSNNGRNSSSPRHSPSLRCSECNLKHETIEEAEAHAAIHHQQQQGFGRSQASSSRTYQCIKCQESFASEAEIEAHVASHLLHEGSVHECHLCRATFDTPLRLQCHLIEHTFEGCGSFTCYMCSSVFTTATRLQQHMVEHGLSARPYDCHHCHQRFFFRAELENHALTHPDAAEGGCRECIASFPDLLRRSVRRQTFSSIGANQHVGLGSHTLPPPCKTDSRSLLSSSPSIPHSEAEIDVGPANGHTTSTAESVDG